jgi:hypothetical protein
MGMDRTSPIPEPEDDEDRLPPDLPPDGRSPVCPVGFCPIGFALTAVDQVRPEAVEHLLAAGRELILAMKAVIDARADAFQRESPLEKIDIE